MSHGHGGHGHSEDPFDKRIATAMAIVAAFLAFVTMLSHNAHNETLILQGDANRLQTESNIFHTQASDAWSYFQAKNIRAYQTQAYLGLIDALDKPAPAPAPAKGKKAAPPPEPAAPPQIIEDWRAQQKKYEGELPKLQAEAEALVKKAAEAAHASQEKLEQSHHAHHRGARFDLGELGIELALILCSVAVLSKRNAFFFAGLASTLVGIAVAGSAFFI